MSLSPRENKWVPDFFGKGAADFYDLNKWVQEIEEGFSALGYSSGLTVSSDEKNVFVKADVPGLNASDVEVSVNNEGILSIKGDRKEEDKGKTYFRKAHQSFSYSIHLMDDVDLNVDPKATCKNGVMALIFTKKKESQSSAKKIKVKEE